jgi:hypothetical protein
MQATSASLTSSLFYGYAWSGSTNQALAGATVTASGSGFSQSVVTGSDGRWEIQLPYGSYTVTFSAPGYQSSSMQLNWSPTSLGQVGRLVDPDHQQRYQTALLATQASGLMLLVGFIAQVVGLPSGHKHPTRYQAPLATGDQEHLNVVPWFASGAETADTTVFCIFCG